jgi:hypothetical protein
MCFVGLFACVVYAGDVEYLGVKFPREKVVAGRTLKLNGVACFRKLGLVNIYAGGFYLETPTSDADEAIESEQIKCIYLYHMAGRATVDKLREEFLEIFEKADYSRFGEFDERNIEKYMSWIDEDMMPGKTFITTYIPGVGLTLEYRDRVRGTIPGAEFARVYFNHILGDRANEEIKNGYLGL